MMHYWRGEDLVKVWQEAGIVACVEATYYEMHVLWREHADPHTVDTQHPVEKIKWVQGANGILHPIPSGFSEYLTYVSINVNLLKDKPVLFWECTSRLADFEAAGKWIHETFPCKCYTNPTNFHHALQQLDKT